MFKFGFRQKYQYFQKNNKKIFENIKLNFSPQIPQIVYESNNDNEKNMVFKQYKLKNVVYTL